MNKNKKTGNNGSRRGVLRSGMVRSSHMCSSHVRNGIARSNRLSAMCVRSVMKINGL